MRQPARGPEPEKVLDFLPVNGFTSGNPSSRIVRFSTFEVDLQTGELRQRGQKIRLQEQPFQVLAALLEPSFVGWNRGFGTS
jgi:hypothetical protein